VDLIDLNGCHCHPVPQIHVKKGIKLNSVRCLWFIVGSKSDQIGPPAVLSRGESVQIKMSQIAVA